MESAGWKTQFLPGGRCARTAPIEPGRFRSIHSADWESCRAGSNRGREIAAPRQSRATGNRWARSAFSRKKPAPGPSGLVQPTARAGGLHPPPALRPLEVMWPVLWPLRHPRMVSWLHSSSGLKCTGGAPRTRDQQIIPCHAPNSARLTTTCRIKQRLFARPPLRTGWFATLEPSAHIRRLSGVGTRHESAARAVARNRRMRRRWKIACSCSYNSQFALRFIARMARVGEGTPKNPPPFCTRPPARHPREIFAGCRANPEPRFGGERHPAPPADTPERSADGRELLN